MLEKTEIEKRIAELEKGLSERGNQVVQSDPQCIAFMNQIQAYKAVLNPPPDMEVPSEVAHEADPTAEA